ncbi:MAG: FAD-binding oxidoreductase [Candidatus Gracilibacteria bacterium]
MVLPSMFQARLKQKITLTPEVREFVFELIELTTLDFQAGQFVLIYATNPATGARISRAYSIASAPSQNHELHIVIAIIKTGTLTPILDTWEIGHELQIQGPFGHFLLKSPADRDLVFVATGTGIAPFHSMIQDRLSQGDTRPMHVYFGVRHEENIFYQREFEKLAKQHPNLHFTLTLSQPSSDWKGPSGRVTALLSVVSFNPATTDVYMCGGKGMIDDVRAIFLQKGFEPSHLYFEQFF